MKKIISYVFAGMVGGLITLSGNMYFTNTPNMTGKKSEYKRCPYGKRCAD